MTTYLAEQNSITRTKINIIKLKMGFCRYEHGVDPCTASAIEKCFNTFPTCQVKSVYNSIGREYKFISANLPASTINDYGVVFPYIKSISDLPTEIKEEDTLVKRLKVEMYDDADYGVGIDPYWEERRQARSFWKTFIQRNKNYRNGIVELWEGFAGIAEDQFQMKFAGKLDNFEYSNGIAMIEAVDLLKELSNIKYPLKVDVRIAANMGNMFVANNQSAMLALDAEQNDYCKRTDFGAINNLVLFAYVSAIGNLVEDTYWIRIIAYDEDERPTHIAGGSIALLLGRNAIRVFFTVVSGALYYRIFIHKAESTEYELYYQTTANLYVIYDLAAAISGTDPIDAERYYQLTGTDPTDLNDWTYLINYNFTEAIEGSQIDLLSTFGGYLRLNKEIIKYQSLYYQAGVWYLSGVTRAVFDTEADWHYEGTYLSVLYYALTPQNPFTMLKILLNLANINDSYISDKFDEYESYWAGHSNLPRVNLKPIIKDEKLSRLYFDLVRLTNSVSWVNEDGKIDIIFHTEYGGTHKVNDEANIISDSFSVDYNEASRMTRWILYWNRFDIEQGTDEANAYSRINIVADADAETDKEYGDIKEDSQYSVWFSEESDDIDKINTYVDELLQKRATRTRDAQEIVECQVELKDANIKTGSIVKLSTKHLQDIYGEDYNEVKFRVIKKEMMGNKIALTLLRFR